MTKRIISLTLVVCILCTIVGASSAVMTFADPRASSYLERYGVSLVAEGKGVMSVDMIVDGVTRMTKIGVLEVYIEEKPAGGSWSYYGSLYGTDDPDTYFDYDSYDYLRTVYFNGRPGYYYHVTITAYARNASGSDTGYATSVTVLCK